MSNVVVKNDVFGEVIVMKKIPQDVIAEYLRMKKDIEKLHNSLLVSLDHGATVEEGDGVAEMSDGSDKKTDKAARAKVIELGGKEAWDNVLENAERRPYHRLAVYSQKEQADKKTEEATKAKAKREAAKAMKLAAQATK